MHLQKIEQKDLSRMRFIPVTLSLHLHYLQYRGNKAYNRSLVPKLVAHYIYIYSYTFYCTLLYHLHLLNHNNFVSI